MRNGKNIGTFLYWGHTTVTTRCGAVVGSVLRGSVLCRKRGRRITENIRVEVDGGGGGVVFVQVVGRSSMEAPLFMVLKLPPPRRSPLSLPSSPCSLSKRAFTPSSFSSFTVNCYSRRNLQSSLLVFVDSTLPKGSSAFTKLQKCPRSVDGVILLLLSVIMRSLAVSAHSAVSV